MAEDEAPGFSASYLVKVAAGVAVLAGIAFFGVVPEWPGLPRTARWGVLAAGALVCAATVPFAAWLYRRSDELHRFMHQSASVATLPLLVALHGLIGALQAANLLPGFNQSLAMLLVLGVWGLQLMLAERRSR
jgi:hypothetical protein